jgi:hypothetical protein
LTKLFHLKYLIPCFDAFWRSYLVHMYVNACMYVCMYTRFGSVYEKKTFHG